jgi:hypothetical protein
VKPNGPPPAPPAEPVTTACGDDSTASTFGPEGGSVCLKDALTLTVPPGGVAGEALSVQLKRDAASSSPSGTAASPMVLETPSLEPRSGGRFELSVATAALTTTCADAGWKLAFERAGTLGPADGTSSPALEWAYEPARVNGGTLSAGLTHLPGMHLQFVCLPEVTP